MAAFFTDGTWTTKEPTGKARISYPFAGDFATYIIEQDFIQLRANYSAAALNTLHSTVVTGGNSSAYLIEIGPHEDLGQGVISWTEVYSTKPADRNEYESYAYNFIGYYGVWGTNITAVTGRPRFTQSVTSRLAHKYYIPGVGADAGIATAADIPILAAQTYIYGATTNNVDYLADSPPFTAATNPTRTAYEALVSGGTEIVAEQSIVRRWRGAIYERVTRYVKAL